MERVKSGWQNFSARHPGAAQFLVFFVVSNGVTVLQMILMPLFRTMLGGAGLAELNFQVLPVGSNPDGSQYYIFNYAAGSLEMGGGGGIAYFLAVQITMAIAQIINFFLQRNVTFKSNANVARAAFWYVIAYVIITFGAAALQGIYRAPVYRLFMNTMGLGRTGETIADAITMLINCVISFWVFFPILKIIFQEKHDGKQQAA